jgi:hypothetical protein
MILERKARKPFHVLLMVTGLLLLAGACNEKEDEIVLEFTVEVPETWEYYLLDEDNFVYWAISPLDGAGDTIREDMLITRETASGATLESYYARVLDDLMEDESFEQRYASDTIINGAPCKKLIHLQTIQSVNQSNQAVSLDVQDMKFVFVRNNRGFVVNCAAPVATYATYKPIFDEIMSTFTFKN